MGMEPINSISSIQAQTMTRPVSTPKVSTDIMDGTAENVTVPKVDNNTVAVAKTQDGSNNHGYENQENAGEYHRHEFRYDHRTPYAVNSPHEGQQHDRTNLKYQSSQKGNQCRSQAVIQRSEEA